MWKTDDGDIATHCARMEGARGPPREDPGDATLFAREDYVEEAWRDSRVSPPGGWQNPTVYLP
jgi:hypothetical protein